MDDVTTEEEMMLDVENQKKALNETEESAPKKSRISKPFKVPVTTNIPCKTVEKVPKENVSAKSLTDDQLLDFLNDKISTEIVHEIVGDKGRPSIEFVAVALSF